MMAKISNMQLSQIVVKLSEKRHPTIRHLPNDISTVWGGFIWDIVSLEDKDRARLLFIIAPHLLTTGRCPRIEGRSDFKSFRRHVQLLRHSEYLEETINELSREIDTLEPAPRINQNNEKLTPSQIKSYIRRGEFSKCYEVKDIKIAECTPETIQKVGEAFPQATLPQPVPENASLTCIFTFSDLLNAYRRLKVCKSPGLSGWTKELLFRVFHNPPMGVQQNLVDMFNCFVNAYISEEEKEFLRTAVLTPFEYIAKEGKIRNIVILDGITKICWNIIFWNLPEDPHVENSGSVFNKKGQCTLATHTIQGALNEGRVVIILDAKNAFPTLLRSAFFDYIQKHYRVYGIMVNFMNMMYAQPIHAKWFAHGRDPITYDITNGTIQGCISGPKLYTLGTIDVHHNCGKVLVQVADDVTVIAKSDPIGNALNVIQRFASVGQQLAGPKTKILLPSTVDEKDIKKMIRNTELQNATIITQPVLSLGTVISPRVPTVQQLNDLLRDKFCNYAKCIENVLELNTSMQIKFLLLQRLPWRWIYFAQTANIVDPERDQIFAAIDEALIAMLHRLLPELREPQHQVRIHSPIEDGGLGFLPLARVHDTVYATSLKQSLKFAKWFGIDLIEPFTRFSTLQTAWKDVADKGIPNRESVKEDHLRIHAARPHMRSWLKCSPMNDSLTISDEKMRFALRLRLGVLEPFSIQCPNFSLPSPSSTQLMDHIFSCTLCGSSIFNKRHERVVTALLKVLRFHGISVSKPRANEFPLPDNERGGPDLIVWCGDTPQAVDVTVVHGNGRKLMHRFTEKMTKYEKYQQVSKHIIVPYVMSAHGVIYQKSRELVRDLWARNAIETTFLSDIFNFTQFACIEGTFDGVASLRTSKSLRDAKQSHFAADA